jgi:hypothetical protein
LRTHAPGNFVNSPAAEQSAHHAADQANRTATATNAVMVRTAATAAGRLVAIDFITGGRLRRQDGFAQ